MTHFLWKAALKWWKSCNTHLGIAFSLFSLSFSVLSLFLSRSLSLRPLSLTLSLSFFHSLSLSLRLIMNSIWVFMKHVIKSYFLLLSPLWRWCTFLCTGVFWPRSSFVGTFSYSLQSKVASASRTQGGINKTPTHDNPHTENYNVHRMSCHGNMLGFIEF